MGKMRTALTPGAETLLLKGRRLTEHTLNTCQLKRVKAAAVGSNFSCSCCSYVNWAAQVKAGFKADCHAYVYRLHVFYNLTVNARTVFSSLVK